MHSLIRIRKTLEELNLSALLVTGAENVSYLTRINGLKTGEREAFLLITKKTNYLFAFSTTYLLYKNVPGFQSLELTASFRLSNALIYAIKEQGLKDIGFESENVTYTEITNLQTKLGKTLTPTTDIIENLRLIKTEDEIGKIKKAAQITDKAFAFILNEIKSGITEKELALKIEFYIKSKSDDIAFTPIVAFNENSAIPHYLPSAKIKLKKKSTILLDFGSKYQGYCSDLSRVVFFGTPNNKTVRIYDTVKKAQDETIKSLKPGISGGELDGIARNFIKKEGFIPYNHGLGHGVGLAIHENPRLRPGITDILRENMVFTIEPGIYIENYAGVRIEDLLVLKLEGPEFLSNASKKIIIL